MAAAAFGRAIGAGRRLAFADALAIVNGGD
jgi:hypothetical protein